MRRTFTTVPRVGRPAVAHGSRGALAASAAQRSSSASSSRPLYSSIAAASAAPRTGPVTSSPLSSLLRVAQRSSSSSLTASSSSSSSPLQRSITSLAARSRTSAARSSSSPSSSSSFWSSSSSSSPSTVTYVSVQHAASLAVVAPQVAHLSTLVGGGVSEKKEGEGEGEDSSSSRSSSSSGQVSPPLPGGTPSGEVAPGPLGKVRNFVKKYGAVGVVTYFGLYGATLASFYGAFSSGLLFAGDVVNVIEFLHLGDLLDESSVSPKLGNFALAWIVTKFTEPLRFAITIAVTPSLSRWWRGHHEQQIAKKKKNKKV